MVDLKNKWDGNNADEDFSEYIVIDNGVPSEGIAPNEGLHLYILRKLDSANLLDEILMEDSAIGFSGSIDRPEGTSSNFRLYGTENAIQKFQSKTAERLIIEKAETANQSPQLNNQIRKNTLH